MLPRASGCQSRLYETSVTQTRRHQVNPLALLIAVAIPMSSVLGASYSTAALFIDVSGLFVILWVPTLDFPPHMGLSVVWILICSTRSLDLFTWGLGDQGRGNDVCGGWKSYQRWVIACMSAFMYACISIPSWMRQKQPYRHVMTLCTWLNSQCQRIKNVLCEK